MLTPEMVQENAMASWLETERGDIIPLPDLCTIGRGDNNHIVLNTSAVSRHHAVINERDSQFWIVDLGSVNGLKVNGTRIVQPARLQPGDRILFPSSLFIFKQGVLPAAVVPKPEEKPAPPEVVTPKPEPVPVPAIALEEIAQAFPNPEAAETLRGRKKRRAARKATQTADADAFLTQKLEVPSFPQDKAASVKPAVREIAPQPFAFQLAPVFPLPPDAALAPAIVIRVLPEKPAEKIEPPRPIEFQRALTFPVPPDTALAPAIIIRPVKEESVQKKETPSSLPFQLAPLFAVPAIQELSSATILVPAPAEDDKQKEPLRPTVVRPASVSSRSGEKKSPPPLPAVLPAAPSKEAPPKLGPIVVHPELLKELPLAPAPVVPLFDEKTEPAIISSPPSASSSTEEKKEPSPKPLPASTDEKSQEKKDAEPAISAASGLKLLEDLKPSSPPISVEAEAKDSIEQPTSSIIPTTRTLVLVTSNPPAICGTAKRSMYIGLASIFLPFLGLITALMAIILGHRALRLIRQSNGALLGRDQAITGLYFGYITLALIATYSTIFYFLYAPPAPSVFSAEAPTTLTFDPTIELPAKPHPPAPVVPSPVTGQNGPSANHLALTPLPFSPTLSSLPAVVPERSSPPDIPATSAVANSSNGSNPLPAKSQDEPTIKNLEPSEKTATSSETAMNSDMGKAATSTPAPSDQGTVPAQPPASFSYQQQERLKDEMLALPMPYESVDSPDYQDADAFNNSARILARKPEAKYAQSVQDFLDDVKARNPDHIRLQILTAMYDNYLAGLENGASQ